jgi:hypothetical protein
MQNRRQSLEKIPGPYIIFNAEGGDRRKSQGELFLDLISVKATTVTSLDSISIIPT